MTMDNITKLVNYIYFDRDKFLTNLKKDKLGNILIVSKKFPKIFLKDLIEVPSLPDSKELVDEFTKIK